MKKAIVAAVILIVVMTSLAQAQRRGGARGLYGIKRPEHITWNSDFTFCRLAYRSREMPAAAAGVSITRARIMNLPIRLSELTKTPVNFDATREPNHVVIQANEPELFKCPFVMITEVGSVYFDEEEAKALRAYLEKGGFLWADDFWGTYEWNIWERELRKVLPASEYPIIDVPMNHSIFHTLFDSKRFPQIPSIGWVYSGTTSERGADSAVANAARESSTRRDASWSSSRTIPTSATRTSASPTIRRTSTISRWKATRLGSTSCSTR